MRPVIHRQKYTDAIYAKVMSYFDEVLLNPVNDVLAERRKANAIKTRSVIAALESGRIWYQNGQFAGTFDAEVSRELLAFGAKYARKDGGRYEVSVIVIPLDVRQVIYATKDKTAKTISAVAALVLLMRNNVDGSDTGIAISEEQKATLAIANKEFNIALSDAVSARGQIGLPAGIETQAKQIEDALRADAKRVMKEEMENLAGRLKRLQQNAAPLAELKKTIEATQKRIKFRVTSLSEHATALLLSQYRKQQAKRLGIRAYVWQTMEDNRVRHDHRLLNHREFAWNDPPVTNTQTGARNHPGEDYFCRCVPLNIIPSNFS
jgi:SPP1 gp7 family putative phage head morphogenesis protein